MCLRLQMIARHADGIEHAVLLIHDVAAWQLVEQFAIFAERLLLARSFDGMLNVQTRDLAPARRDGHRAVGVARFQMAPRRADIGSRYLATADLLGMVERDRDGVGGLFDVDDGAVAQPR